MKRESLTTAAAGLFAVARSAIASPTARLIAGIRFIVGVSVRAMRRKYALDSSTHVLGGRHEFKVFGPNAVANAAQVIPVHTFGRAPNKKVVGGSFELPIALPIKGSRPKPARVRLIDMRPEPLFWRAFGISITKNHGRIAPLGPARPMRNAPTPSPNRFLAAINGARFVGNIRPREPDIWLAVTQPSEVMHLAPAPRFNGAVAVLNGAGRG